MVASAALPGVPGVPGELYPQQPHPGHALPGQHRGRYRATKPSARCSQAESTRIIFQPHPRPAGWGTLILPALLYLSLPGKQDPSGVSHPLLS